MIVNRSIIKEWQDTWDTGKTRRHLDQYHKNWAHQGITKACNSSQPKVFRRAKNTKVRAHETGHKRAKHKKKFFLPNPLNEETNLIKRIYFFLLLFFFTSGPHSNMLGGGNAPQIRSPPAIKQNEEEEEEEGVPCWWTLYDLFEGSAVSTTWLM